MSTPYGFNCYHDIEKLQVLFFLSCPTCGCHEVKESTDHGLDDHDLSIKEGSDTYKMMKRRTYTFICGHAVSATLASTVKVYMNACKIEQVKRYVEYNNTTENFNAKFKFKD